MRISESHFSYRQLSAFFIPLGFSASLTSITHVIINGTLSRGENAAYIIACYAVAFALFGIIERPIIVFRQTCSALVSDVRSFKLLAAFLLFILTLTLLLGSLLAYTFIGDWVYTHGFNASENMVNTISQTFKVITIVIIFSGIRGIYQGVIINHLETKWLTVGVVIRLCAMFIVSYMFVHFDYITSVGGAIIFLVGMFVECLLSVYKGHFILKRQKATKEGANLQLSDITGFYTPLMFYFIMQTVLIPIIYVFLAKSENIEVSIASFALAFSITQMMLSFFMYTHQIVLQFYKQEKRKVINFIIVISIVPSLLLCFLCYSPAGLWFMEVIMGADEELAITTLAVLKFFIIKTLVFPWVDFLNGFLMLQRQTKRMLIAQIVNLVTVVLSLLFLVRFFPNWNGANGAIAASVGELAGLLIVTMIVYRMSDNYKRRKGMVNMGG